jgi:hypothetical protein
MNTASERFTLGQVVATPASLDLLEEHRRSAVEYLRRHTAGDWGDVDASDQQANEAAVRSGNRLFSVYRITADLSIWIITEADRSATTILLPSEY